MYTWFQNLNDNKKRPRWFHFRGRVGSSYDKNWFKYELSSGPACRFTIEPRKRSTAFTIGFLFFTLYFTIYFNVIPFLKKGREYGFYIYDWELWMMMGNRPMESSNKDPWYYRIVIRPKDIIFGKRLHFKSDGLRSYSLRFFKFRGNTYAMDEMTIETRYWMRSRIPYGLYHDKRTGIALEIKEPPMHSGKGTTSYNCGDDGIYGMTVPWEGKKTITYRMHEEVYEYTCKEYCKSCMRDIKRYGRGGGDDLNKEEVGFEYIGYDKKLEREYLLKKNKKEAEAYEKHFNDADQYGTEAVMQ
jgi:hypothetical protein